MFSRKRPNTTEPSISTSEGFGEIYDLYADKLFRIAYNQLKDKAEAENTVHDVFCRLWERKDTLQINGPVENYLVKAVKLAVLSHVRKKIGHNQVSLQVNRDTVAALSQNSLEYDFRFNELVERTNELVSELPPRCQEVYKLSQEKALTNREIASSLLLSDKTVHAHLTKAVKYLTANLRKHFNK